MRTLLSIAAALTLTLVALTPVRADEATDKEVQAVLTKAIDALGGEQNLNKHKSLTIKSKGKVNVMAMDLEYTNTLILQRPHQMWMEVNVDIQGKSIVFIQGLDGDKGWRKLLDNVTDMDKDELAEAREQMYSYGVTMLTPLKGKEFTLKPLGEVKVGDQPAAGILVSHKDHRDISLYFDKKTGLLVKSESRGKDPQGGNEFTAETFYSDYKEFDGVKHAMKMKVNRDGKSFLETENTEVTPQDKLEASTFAKPK